MVWSPFGPEPKRALCVIASVQVFGWAARSVWSQRPCAEVRVAAADLRALGVQHHDVPGSEVVAVVAVRRRAGRGSEVGVVAGGIGRVVVVVPGGGPRARAVPSPGRAVAGVELGQRARVVDVVAQREDGAGDAVEQRRGLLVVVAAALRDVAGADEDLGVRADLDLARRRDDVAEAVGDRSRDDVCAARQARVGEGAAEADRAITIR